MLKAQLKNLPTRPGVYLFKDAAGEVVYVGKASSLRPRVRSYFSVSKQSPKTREMMRHVVSLETIVVGSEAEALILEANLIKEYHPRFNIQLRDDKRYPYIKVTTEEPFPRVFVTRKLHDDGSRYFGPYTSVGVMRQALEVIKRLYTVRSCSYDLPREAPERACLDYHIGRCLAPCIGLQDRASYGAMIGEILKILDGETEGVRKRVADLMQEASDGLEFERAARLRDVLSGLDSLARQQRVERLRGGDYDVVGLARDGDLAATVVLRIRSGVLLGRDTQRFSDVGDESDASLITTFASRYYLSSGTGATRRASHLPREILIPSDFDDRELVEDILSAEAGRRLRVYAPKKGSKARLSELAADNARHALEDRLTALEQVEDRAETVLYDLRDRLDLKIVPRLIVCVDISHHQGTETVGSAIVFENGAPKKSEYRHMRVKGDWGNDDYRSMAEVVSRYFRRRMDEERPIPDLLVVDGGKGQLGAARAALEELGVTDVALAALAKREEVIFRPDRSDPIRLGRKNPALHLLQRLRDEAHRFAISYNRKLRKKRTLRSDLGEIPGIGPERQKLLLSRFGSVRGVRGATAQELARLPGISEGLAVRVLTYLGS
ncbi:MAG: excinuclease ABC subunit UvrC [Gemmatimonadetes bacterium]|nr:excinuclease ABC subunit UvrC [Gemmatimonadota bacterium]